jgi:Tol biopolymer transport system component
VNGLSALRRQRPPTESDLQELERELRAEDDRIAEIEASTTREELDSALGLDIARPAQGVRPVRMIFILALAASLTWVVFAPRLDSAPAVRAVKPRAAPRAQPAYDRGVAQAYQRPGGGRGGGALIDLPARAGVFLIAPSGGATRQLTPSWGIGASPAWRPDGRALVLVWNAELVEVGVRGKSAHPGEPIWSRHRTLTPPQGVFSPTYSPDGSKVAFVSARSIWVVRRGAAPKQLTQDGPNYYSVDWSPQGKTLVAMRNGATMLVSLGSKSARKVLTGRDGWSPRWSPDGKQIAVTSLDYGGFPHVFLTDRWGEYFNQLAAGGAMTQYASWSPDGRRLVYAKFVTAAGEWDLFTYDLESKQERQLTHTTLVNETTPVWSPDGKLVAYVRSTSA